MIDVKDGGELLEISVSERITETEVESLKRQLEIAMSDEVDPRVLCVVSEFWGFDSRAAWEELDHWLRHLHRPARVAVLAEHKWVRALGNPDWAPGRFELRAFDTTEEPAARRWLSDRGGARRDELFRDETLSPPAAPARPGARRTSGPAAVPVTERS